jgi:Uma2 family endonuclease
MRVRILSAGVYVYPDVVVTCEKPQFEDAEVDTLVNPLVIIEVSSRSTESYDRGKKFGFCREIESLREYVLISQQSAHVERFFRGDDGVWRFNDANGLEAVMELPTIGCRIKLADVYAKVEFPPEDEINRAAGLFPSGETR